MVDIHDPTATPTRHDPNYTLQSNINIAGLFYIRYTHRGSYMSHWNPINLVETSKYSNI